MNDSVQIVYDPRLIEEAVFHAQRDHYVSAQIHQRRNLIYQIDDADERERRFNELYRSWFDRLGLAKVIEQNLREQPLIGARVERCVAIAATQAKEEGAELYVAPEDEKTGRRRYTLRLLIRPESLLHEEPLRAFLRHELFHIRDMLDAAFGYQPTLPKAAGGPTYDSLITARYRVLWDVTIAGRMARRGWCAATVRAQALEDFRQTFAMLDGRCEEYFARFFDAAQPRHEELAAFALDPRAATGDLSHSSAAATHCPLCRFPTHDFDTAPARLGAEILAAIKEDFADWTPAQGLCVQCADLYRGRRLSMAALKLLPGWNPCPTRD